VKAINLLCAGDKVFVKYQAKCGGLTPPHHPLRTSLDVAEHHNLELTQLPLATFLTLTNVAKRVEQLELPAFFKVQR